MNAAIILAAGLVIVTKLLDCITTMRSVRIAAAETNRLARAGAAGRSPEARLRGRGRLGVCGASRGGAHECDRQLERGHAVRRARASGDAGVVWGSRSARALRPRPEALARAARARATRVAFVIRLSVTGPPDRSIVAADIQLHLDTPARGEVFVPLGDLPES
jgi:hypothetical protein